MPAFAPRFVDPAAGPANPLTNGAAFDPVPRIPESNTRAARVIDACRTVTRP